MFISNLYEKLLNRLWKLLRNNAHAAILSAQVETEKKVPNIEMQKKDRIDWIILSRM